MEKPAKARPVGGDRSEVLMRSGTVAFCADCGVDSLFVPAEDGWDFDGCEFCCTGCNAAVFLFETVEHSSARRRGAA